MNLALLRQVVPLLTGEFTLATLKQLRQDPVLGEYFLAHYGNGPENQIFDALAADHYHLFGLEVFPYGTVFFNEDAQLGGPEAAMVANAFLEAQLEPPSEPDQLGQELSLLVHLLEQKPQMASDFLRSRLMSWYFCFLAAVVRMEHPFFNPLFQQVTQTLTELGYALPGEATAIPEPSLGGAELLSLEDTGLSDITRFLATPRYSGVFLSRKTIKDLADLVEIPVGFGTRSQLLPQLFYSAIDYGHLPELLTQLLEYFRAILEDYHTWEKTWPGGLDYWKERCHQSIDLLERMRQEAMDSRIRP
ncbi:MAG: hypothetical protein A2527_07755 [Candidatus Lambdaproteobacteria bacterium RIFOXYD2_FULL_50_16]|uniref:Uncharacterized protein n=1 Tax=Candidatus Lambdaproteobacteria bacterium RIFOXYD2_FULL_50_16 TaxID=1817772 RepID=A0A1F6GBE2_9PROT|nr:MAG: hypothetical protein A2527_07755 [Candidatus Lambdaproteobacteria bacterium RIFOXYD2_FULL_50_16]